jgi:phage terminase small subunit
LLPNPLIKIAKDSQVAAMVILKEFGLTAKARTKLPQLTTETEDSPLDAFLKAQLGAKETR